jgi:hypothetical protein
MNLCENIVGFSKYFMGERFLFIIFVKLGT